MRVWARFAFAAAAPLLLASCLWGPGKFNSTLALHKNGSFVLDYKGEIQMQLPEERGAATEPWSDKLALCYTDGRTKVADYTMESGSVRKRGDTRREGRVHAALHQGGVGQA